MTDFQSHIFFLSLFLLTIGCKLSEEQPDYDVVVLGEGTGGVTAALQSARSGAKTLYVNPLSWHGGMLTSAGVSATDGNHQLPSGLWAEWRELIRNHYGGKDSIFTGWVSNTMFEPSVGAYYFDELVANEKLLDVMKNAMWGIVTYSKGLWRINIEGGDQVVSAKVLIDGTDLGDVAAQLGVTYDTGTDSRAKTNESIAPQEATSIVQDLTYAAILQSYPGKDMTISRPEDYDPSRYDCSCAFNCDLRGRHDCEQMLSYGQLPNEKFMINWPFHGNDFYANVIDMSRTERMKVFEEAKQHTLGFVYYIQNELGFSHLGLSDEFGTEDKLPLMPYHREGRRIKGLAQLKLLDVVDPFSSELYKTGIAVGDYPIDHHHAENPDAPEFDFPPVPSFSVPLGSLLPKNVEHLIIADKAISVTNIVNGSTRLQPVVMQIGQTAGLIAAIASKENKRPRDISIRRVQSEILEYHGYLLPYIDCKPEDDSFRAVQRIGATGILRGKGIPYKWANQTWFYPDSLVTVDLLHTHLSEFDERLENISLEGEYLGVEAFIRLIAELQSIYSLDTEKIVIDGPQERHLSRAEFAILLDTYIDPFHLFEVDHLGMTLSN